MECIQSELLFYLNYFTKGNEKKSDLWICDILGVETTCYTTRDSIQHQKEKWGRILLAETTKRTPKGSEPILQLICVCVCVCVRACVRACVCVCFFWFFFLGGGGASCKTNCQGGGGRMGLLNVQDLYPQIVSLVENEEQIRNLFFPEWVKVF